MNHPNKSFPSPILMLFILIAVIGCALVFFVSGNQNSGKARSPEPEIEKLGEIVSLTSIAAPYYTAQFYTFRHDNHLFIVRNGSGSGALLHHPDCPCNGAK